MDGGADEANSGPERGDSDASSRKTTSSATTTSTSVAQSPAPSGRFRGDTEIESLYLFAEHKFGVDEQHDQALLEGGRTFCQHIERCQLTCSGVHPNDPDAFLLVASAAEDPELATLPRRDISSVWPPCAAVVDGDGDSHATPESISGAAVKHLFFDSGPLTLGSAHGLRQFFPNLVSFQYTCSDGYHSCGDWSALAELKQLRKLTWDMGGTHQGESVDQLTTGILPLKGTLQHLELGDFRTGDRAILRMYERLTNLRYHLCHVGDIGEADYSSSRDTLQQERQQTLDLSNLAELRVLKISGGGNVSFPGGFCLPAEGIKNRLALRLPGTSSSQCTDHTSVSRPGDEGAAATSSSASCSSSSSSTPMLRAERIFVLDDPLSNCTRALYSAFSTSQRSDSSDGTTSSRGQTTSRSTSTLQKFAGWRLVAPHQYEPALTDPALRFRLGASDEHPGREAREDVSATTATSAATSSSGRNPDPLCLELVSVGGWEQRQQFATTLLGHDAALALLQSAGMVTSASRPTNVVADWIRVGHDFRFEVGDSALLLHLKTLQFTRCTILSVPRFSPRPPKLGKRHQHAVCAARYSVLEHDVTDSVDFSAGFRAESWRLFRADLFASDVASPWTKKRFVSARGQHVTTSAGEGERYFQEGEVGATSHGPERSGLHGDNLERRVFWFDGYECEEEHPYPITRSGADDRCCVETEGRAHADYHALFDVGGRTIWNHRLPRRLLFNTAYGDTRDALFEELWKERTGGCAPFTAYKTCGELLRREASSELSAYRKKLKENLAREFSSGECAIAVGEVVPSVKDRDKLLTSGHCSSRSTVQLQAAQTRHAPPAGACKPCCNLVDLTEDPDYPLTRPEAGTASFEAAGEDSTFLFRHHLEHDPATLAALNDYREALLAELTGAELSTLQRALLAGTRWTRCLYFFSWEPQTSAWLYGDKLAELRESLDEQQSDLQNASVLSLSVSEEMDIMKAESSSSSLSLIIRIGDGFGSLMTGLPALYGGRCSWQDCLTRFLHSLAAETGPFLSSFVIGSESAERKTKRNYYENEYADASPRTQLGELQEADGTRLQLHSLYHLHKSTYPGGNESWNRRDSSALAGFEWKDFFAKCPLLRFAQLDGCPTFNDDALTTLATACPLLEQLYVSGPPPPDSTNLYLDPGAALWTGVDVSSACLEELFLRNKPVRVTNNSTEDEVPVPGSYFPRLTAAWLFDIHVQKKVIEGEKQELNRKSFLKELREARPHFVAFGCGASRNRLKYNFVLHDEDEGIFEDEHDCNEDQDEQDNYEGQACASVTVPQCKICLQRLYPKMLSSAVVSAPATSFLNPSGAPAIDASDANPNGEGRLSAPGAAATDEKNGAGSDVVAPSASRGGPGPPTVCSPVDEEHRAAPEVSARRLICGRRRVCEIAECGHQFHTECLAKWEESTCPVCRGPAGERHRRAARVLPLGAKLRTTWPSLAKNSICRVQGLQKRPDLNGQEVAVRHFDFRTDRYVCDLIFSDATVDRCALTLKESNLSLLHAVRFTLAELQSWVDRCAPGQRLCVPSGIFVADEHKWSSRPEAIKENPDGNSENSGHPHLLVNKPISLCGTKLSAPGRSTTTHTTLLFPVLFDPAEASGGNMLCVDMRIQAPVEVRGRGLRSFLLRRVDIFGSTRRNLKSALSLIDTAAAADRQGEEAQPLQADFSSRRGTSPRNKKKPRPRVVLEECVIDFSDNETPSEYGVSVQCPSCLLRRCEIRNALRYGLVADQNCAVKECRIEQCYSGAIFEKAGVKVRRLGTNSIQNENGLSDEITVHDWQEVSGIVDNLDFRDYLELRNSLGWAF